MPNERVVINASPLILLFKSNLDYLLPELFAEILIPGAVWDEVTAAGQSDAAANSMPTRGWAKRVDVITVAPHVTPWNLGPGESEVLTLALSSPECRAMIDDAAARACARTIGIKVLGTGGALILAKRGGLISSVGAALQSLRDAGFWLSADIEQLLKQKAGE